MPGEDDNEAGDNPLGQHHMERQRRAREREEEQRRNNPNAPARDAPGEEEAGLFRRMVDGIREEPQRNRQKRARDEGFCGALQMNLCPTLRFCSFTTLIVCIDIVMFIISLWLYRIVNTEFLAPNPRALDILGWKDARKIKKRNQVWRFITPVFLHASFMHLALNILSTIVIGSGLENGLGFWRLFSLYFFSGFGGILFSCVFNPLSYSVGASTAIFGLIGYYISYLCIEWQRLGETNPMQRFTLIIFILLILLFNFQIGITEANVDNLGHLGGLIVGIIMGFAISENDERRERQQSCWEWVKNSNFKNKCGFIVLTLYLLVFVLLFYLLIEV